MLQLWASQFGVPVGDGPIWRIEEAEIVVAELGQFSSHTIVLPSADRQAVHALPAFTLIDIEQLAVAGTPAAANGHGVVIASGYVLNPSKQMQDGTTPGTINLTLFPLTVEATWYFTRRGWVAANKMSVIADRLGNLIGGDARVPQWTGIYLDKATVDPQFSVRFENPTVLDAFLQFVVDSDTFARLGRNADGSPARRLEMGQFGVDSGVKLVSVDGGTVDDIVADGTQAIILSYTHNPNDVAALVNICTPLGGGSGDTQVSLERLWRMINDTTYIHYNRWGPDADVVARTGKATSTLPNTVIGTANLIYAAAAPTAAPLRAIPLAVDVTVLQWAITGSDGAQWAQVTYSDALGTTTGYMPLTNLTASLFPEYDAVNYPIDCVESEQAGKVFYDQGTHTSRAATLDGRFDYDVYDFASVVQWGTKRGSFMESSLNYADSTVFNQELTARSLYMAAIANFKRRSQPHEVWECTATGLGMPPQGGDLVTIDFRKVEYDDDGAIVTEDVFKQYKVMKAVRAFQGEQAPIDTFTLSNLGRFTDDDTVQATDAAHQLRSVQINQGTGLSVFPIWAAGNVDAANPLHVPIKLPGQIFRVGLATLRVDFFPYRGSATTAQNTPGTPIEIWGDIEGTAGIDHGGHNLAGTGVTDAGIAGTTDGFDLVQTGVDNDAVVKIIVSNDGGNQPLGQRLNAELLTNQGSVGTAWQISSGGLPDGTPMGANMKINFTKAKTKSAFTAAVKKAVSVATRLTAFLPSHTHPLDLKIPTNTPAPVSITVTVNSLSLSSGVTVVSGTRNANGSFSSSFEVADISQYVNFPGTVIDLAFAAGTDVNSNPNGVGYIQVSGTWIVEIGGLTSIVQAA